MSRPFSGSYPCGDVEFLLKPLDIIPIADVDHKEALLQGGRYHYSEILGEESVPSQPYLDLFRQAIEKSEEWISYAAWRLARRLVEENGENIVLVSLARAGTPIGVIVRRLLRDGWGVHAPHYSVSIIRDRGIDSRALDYICCRHGGRAVTFLDGWTGKGLIARELKKAVVAYNAERHAEISPDLYVLVDLCGQAKAAGILGDYLVPSAMLNATVSGLISRTVLNDMVGPTDFHGCLHYQQFAEHDMSESFVNHIHERCLRSREVTGCVSGLEKQVASERLGRLVKTIADEYHVENENLIKPGICEATRALLRRSPRCLLVRDAGGDDVKHLLFLADERRAEVVQVPDLSVSAVAIIQRLGK